MSQSSWRPRGVRLTRQTTRPTPGSRVTAYPTAKHTGTATTATSRNLSSGPSGTTRNASITETSTTGCTTYVAYDPRPALAISGPWVGQRRRTQARHHNENVTETTPYRVANEALAQLNPPSASSSWSRAPAKETSSRVRPPPTMVTWPSQRSVSLDNRPSPPASAAITPSCEQDCGLRPGAHAHVQ